MKLRHVLQALLAFGLLATAACAPATGDVSRLSTRDDAGCAFGADSCDDLHRLRPPAW